MKLGRTILVASLIFLTACSTSGPKAKKWKNDERADLHNQLGWNYMRHNQLNTAREAFNEALKLQSNHPEANYGLALISSRQNDDARAERYFARAARSGHLPARNEYAISLCRRGQVNDGLAQAQQAIEDSSSRERAAALTAKGFCYFKDQKNTAAEKEFRRALGMDPRNGQALFHMAEIKIGDEDFLSARAYLERYFASHPATPKSLFYAVEVERNLGDHNAANEYVASLRRSFPDSLEVKELLRADRQSQ